MAISVEDIKKLRAMTSAGMALCKEALIASKGNFDEAVKYINAKSDVISRLRNLTGVKIGLAKIALEDAKNDFEKAVSIINERGWNEPVGNDTTENMEGVIDAYVHGIERKSVALVEVICKTDFVARNEEFRSFVHELALQVSATKAKYVSQEDIPTKELKELKSIFTRETKEEKKPAAMAKKIVEGKLSKYMQEHVLLEQKWFKDESRTMKNLLDEMIQKMGEPLVIRRILFWELGR